MTKSNLGTIWSAHMPALLFFCGIAMIGCNDSGTSEDQAGESEIAASIRAVPFGSTKALDELPHANLEVSNIDVASATDKSRRTTQIGYNNLIGNGVVFLFNRTLQSYCSAQVINRIALLTAAHCIDPLGLANGATLEVWFTNRAGTSVRLFNGSATGIKQPNDSRGYQDTAVIILNSLSTCQGTLSDCATNHPDIPVNAAFQFFDPNQTNLITNTYSIVGYGGDTDTPTTQNAGVLRTGTMTNVSTAFTSDKTGYSTLLQWTQDDQARPCGGDSGSPLLTGLTIAGRVIHTGMASIYLNEFEPCNDAAGGVFYSGLSTSQASWVLQILAAVRGVTGNFHCTAASQSGLNVFVCDNDATVF